MTITTDAYAQTNTERLITVVDNTNEANSLLTDLLAAVSNGFAQVLEMLGAVDSDLETIHDDLGTVHDDLEAVHADLNTVHADLEALDSDIQALSNTVGGLGAAASAITSINQGITTNAASIAALNDKLDMIAETVGVVQETVETGPAPTTTNMLHSDDTEQAIAVADFAASVARHPTDATYEASNTFSCDGDVFVDTMSVSGVNAALGSDAPTTGPTAKSTITVEGFFLYEATDVDATDTFDNVEITKTRDFDNRFLRAGDGLVIKGETDQSTSDAALGARAADPLTPNLLVYSNGTAGDTGVLSYYFTIQEYVSLQSNKATIGAGTDQNTANAAQNATKTSLGTVELYTVTVEWFAPNSDTTCSISSAVDSAPGLDASGTRLVSLTVDEEADEPGALKPFNAATLDCNGEDTEITGISIEAGGFLTQYVELTLTAGSESATVLFDGNEPDEDTSELPFRFSGSDLAITGEGINDLLLNISYDTVDKNTCR